MLHIHHSNQLKELACALLNSYKDTEEHPFTQRTIICETNSLSRWLNHQFCQYEGVSCLVDTPLPADLLWRQARLSLSLEKQDDPLTRERLQWLIFATLDKNEDKDKNEDMNPSFWSHSGLDEIRSYLTDNDHLKRWQLAGRIADTFDRYQYYRPDMIRNWSAGMENNWQSHLWRSITENIDIHRVTLMDAFLEKLGNGQVEHLPARIDLFAIHNLPPLLLQAFNAISQHPGTAIHFWLQSPTDQYWADLATPKKIAQQRRKAPDDLSLWQAGNPLLTQWGRQGQVLQDLLLDDNIHLQEDSGHFVAPEGNSLLNRIKTDIFDAVATENQKESDNLACEQPLPSIQFNICHGPLRECQVLHDNLLSHLQADDSLQPEDILVLVPEISRYAPYIEAVFGSIADNTRIPYNISDVIQADEHPLIQAFLDLLNLTESRFTRTEVLGLANIPQVRQRFGLEESDMAELSELFDKLNIFWGLNGQDKQRNNLPTIDENTWHQGFARIMAGFAMGNEDLLAIGTATEQPIAAASRITAGNAEKAARFLDLLDTLEDWPSRLRKPAEPAEWAERLNSLVDKMFAQTSDDDKRLERIREAINDLYHAEAGGIKTLTLDVIRYWLTQTLNTQTGKSHFYSGGVTFCAMKPLRGVPFRVIALLGMQDTAYPRRKSRNEFDRMNDGWSHGDPDPVQEDRYLFLEAVLAARETLIISYTGRNAKTNDALQPSVLVQELLDYLDENYLLGECKPSTNLARVHPLHPFSPANFTSEEPANDMDKKGAAPTPIPSFDRRWLQTATAIHRHQQPDPETTWPAYSIDLPEHFEPWVTPQQLAAFFKKPIKQFIARHLRLYEPDELELVDDEPFDLNNLENWTIRSLFIDEWLNEQPDNTTNQLVRARGMLPHGPHGDAILNKIRDEFENINDNCKMHEITPPLSRESVDIDMTISTNKHHWKIRGRINDTYKEHGLLVVTASKFSLTKMLPLWINHLCLHADGKAPEGTARFIGLDASATLIPVPTEKAKKHLGDLLALYESGLKTPLAFSDYTSIAFINKFIETNNEKDALKEARARWLGGFNHPGECEDFYNRVILHSHQWQPDETMADITKKILNPLTQYISQES